MVNEGRWNNIRYMVWYISTVLLHVCGLGPLTTGHVSTVTQSIYFFSTLMERIDKTLSIRYFYESAKLTKATLTIRLMQCNFHSSGDLHTSSSPQGNRGSVYREHRNTCHRMLDPSSHPPSHRPPQSALDKCIYD